MTTENTSPESQFRDIPLTAPPPTPKRASRRPKTAPGEPRACSVPTNAGEPCPATPLNGEPACFMHSTRPRIVAERDAARARAGLSTALRRLPPDFAIDLSSPERVLAVLEGAGRAVLAGQISPSQGNTLVAVAQTSLKVRELQLAIKISEIEERLNEQETRPTRVVGEGSK